MGISSGRATRGREIGVRGIGVRGIGVRGIGAGAGVLLVLGLAGAPLAAQGTGGTVPYFGQTICGEEFVFCLDRSASMAWNGTIALMVAETGNAISALDPTQNFSIVAFSSATSVFSTTMLPAGPANVAAALQWLAGLSASGDTCVADGVIQSLAILDSGSGDGAVVLVGDGVPSCGGTSNPSAELAAITAANVALDPILSIYLATDSSGITFYQQVTAQNPGTGVGCAATFRRGDANGDDAVDLADAIRILDISFGSSTAPICEDAADVNDDGVFQGIPDAISLLGVLFGGAMLPAPTPGCGPDPTADVLTCAVQGSCP